MFHCHQLSNGGFSTAIDKLGSTIFLGGGTSHKDPNQAISTVNVLKFSSTGSKSQFLQLDPKLELEMTRPRKECSSLVIRDCLFVMFGEHSNNEACTTVEYLPVYTSDRKFRTLPLTRTPGHPEDLVPLSFKRPMIFPDLKELRWRDHLTDSQTRVFFFGGDYSPSDENLIILRLYQLVIEWDEALPVRVKVGLAQ